MKGRKMIARRERRKKAWDESKWAGEDGFKRPGSNKKPFPRGSKVH